MFRHCCIKNVKDGIQFRVYKIKNECVKHFSQFISEKVKINLRKSQAQFREKLRKLRLRQNDGFLIKKTCNPQELIVKSDFGWEFIGGKGFFKRGAYFIVWYCPQRLTLKNTTMSLAVFQENLGGNGCSENWTCVYNTYFEYVRLSLQFLWSSY